MADESIGAVRRAVSSDVMVTRRFGELAAPIFQAEDVVLLSGDLGAGKTQFTKGVALGLGSAAKVTSPTFNIMLSYEDGRIPLFHFDLYRLDEEDQLYDVDYFGILEDEGVSLVEWGNRFPEAVPEEYLAVHIRVAYDEAAPDEAPKRVLYMWGVGERGRQLADAWVAATATGDAKIDWIDSTLQEACE